MSLTAAFISNLKCYVDQTKPVPSHAWFFGKAEKFFINVKSLM